MPTTFDELRMCVLILVVFVVIQAGLLWNLAKALAKDLESLDQRISEVEDRLDSIL